MIIFYYFSGTLSVEAIYQDRDQFAQLVREVASPDVGKMGIEILSFTIKDIYDNVEYLSSLGRAQTANVKRDADIGVAEANRDAGIRVRHFCFSFLGAGPKKQIWLLSCRVATVREKYLENDIFFQVREKSGNFVDGQGKLERT